VFDPNNGLMLGKTLNGLIEFISSIDESSGPECDKKAVLKMWIN
jgi:hypothetical protein